MGIDFLSRPRQTYLVQAATSQAAAIWLTLATNVAAANGVWRYTDPLATNHPMRFYRLRLQ